jgi:predicted ABC-type ATPase
MNEPPPQLVIVAGQNGAGKSTIAPQLLRVSFGLKEFVNADAIAQGLSGFNVESVAAQAGRIMLQRIRQLAVQRVSFAFETTLASRSFAPLICSLKKQGYQTHLVFLWLPSPDLAIARVGIRVADGGHDVSDHTIRRRYYRGLQNLTKLYAPLVDSWRVFDGASDGVPKEIARGINGEVAVRNDTLWQVIQEQVNA